MQYVQKKLISVFSTHIQYVNTEGVYWAGDADIYFKHEDDQKQPGIGFQLILCDRPCEEMSNLGRKEKGKKSKTKSNQVYQRESGRNLGTIVAKTFSDVVDSKETSMQDQITESCRKQLLDKAEAACIKGSLLLGVELTYRLWYCMRSRGRNIYQRKDRKSLRHVNIHLKDSPDGVDDVSW